MAVAARRLPENVPGDFFVDEICIDCETCREVAPLTFADTAARRSSRLPPAGDPAARPARAHGARRVPDGLDRHRAPARRVGRPPPLSRSPSMPTSTTAATPRRRRSARRATCSAAAGGQRPRRLAAGGRAAAAGDRARWAACAGCSSPTATTWPITRGFRRALSAATRILHEGDVGPGTADVERRPRGRERSISPGDGLTIIPVPGHTRGSAALLYRSRILFTGDHLWAAKTADGSTRVARRLLVLVARAASAPWSACSTSGSSGCCPATAAASARRRRRDARRGGAGAARGCRRPTAASAAGRRGTPAAPSSVSTKSRAT